MKLKLTQTKIGILGLISLSVVLAELAAGYVLLTQDSRVLQGVAVIIGAKAVVVLADKFIK